MADFFQHLNVVKPDDIYGRVIYVDVNRRCIDGQGQPKVRWSVVIQASAVVASEDGGQYLLQAGEDCGLDYEDASKEHTGTERAKSLREALEDRCVDLKLRLLPGVVSE
ncbi:MAG: hypothetical protein Q7N50_03355 [Armatimonadota bacterium]|nr:hypothetical protein [Armatimonadota bacterium]